MLVRASASSVLFLAMAGLVFSQETAAPARDPVDDTQVVPAMTLVMLRMSDRVSSQESEPGDKFGFTVDEDVRVRGRTVIPRGAEGVGEVIHVERARRDRPGELSVVAHYVRVAGQEVKLRGFIGGSANPDFDALAVNVMTKSTDNDRGMAIVLGRNGLASARTASEMRLPAGPPIEGLEETAPEPTTIDVHSPTGTLVFFRERSPRGVWVVYKVREGKDVLGRLSSGTWFKVDVPVGRHVYRVHSEISNDLAVEVEPGATHYIIGGVSLGIIIGQPNLAASNKYTFDQLLPTLVDRTQVALGDAPD
jgi:hypothetical protein